MGDLIELGEEKMFETIRAHFPDISWKLFEVFDNGWDNQVIILDHKIVFRFPRNEYIKGIHQKEGKLLDLASKYVDLTIPNYTLLTNDHSCVGYEAISGIPMTVDIYQGLSDAIKLDIQKQIATFLTQLHSIPLDELEKIGYSHTAGNTEYFKNDFLNTCGYLFTDKEIDVVLEYIKQLEELNRKHKVIVHCDIQEKNIFIDNSLSHITGIIDFSDAVIADPALDFGRLSEYGDGFINGVYRAYQGIKDDKLLDRAMFYNKRLAIFMLIDAVHKNENIEGNLRIFRDTFF